MIRSRFVGMRSMIRRALVDHGAHLVGRWIHSPECSEICARHGFFPARLDYMSPIPNLGEASESAFDRRFSTAGIEWRTDDQWALLADLSHRYGAEPGFPGRSSGPFGFHLEQGRFPNADAGIAYMLLRNLGPRRVVEIGSGYSSLLIAEVGLRNRADGKPMEHVVIDPFFATEQLARAQDSIRAISLPVQEAPDEPFESLAEGDVLFVDSSHVVKLGSDVQHLLLERIPSLRPGVVVHFHDIYLPFEYPRQWARDGNFYNESYFVHAFLLFNCGFEILVAGHLLDRLDPERLRRLIPGTVGASSLWLRRVASLSPSAAVGEREPDVIGTE